jgi:alcohol dehydrogenase YqhD (iron-dependent ADH family)
MSTNRLGQNENVATKSVTVTAAAAAQAVLTLPAPATGLRIYVTALIISRATSAALTAAATPTLVTSTGITGTPTFDVPADAAAQGVIDRQILTFNPPLEASADAAAVTVTGPATTAVIWRITGFYYEK